MVFRKAKGFPKRTIETMLFAFNALPHEIMQRLANKRSIVVITKIL